MNAVMLRLCTLGAVLAVAVLGLVLYFLVSKGFAYLAPGPVRSFLAKILLPLLLFGAANAFTARRKGFDPVRWFFAFPGLIGLAVVCWLPSSKAAGIGSEESAQRVQRGNRIGAWMVGIYALIIIGAVVFDLHKHPELLPLFTELPNHDNERAGGMAQSIYGTLVLLLLASSIGLPFGILGGIYQVEARGRFASLVRFFTDVLNGIPSIVIGIFVYAMVVYPLAQAHPGEGFSAQAGGIALGIMMIPTVMRTTEEILRLVPFSMTEASLGLGATRWRTMWSVILPAARGGIITGVMLALARIAGETAPLLFTILGNEFFTTHTATVLGLHMQVPTVHAPIDALPLRIYNYATGVDTDQNNLAWAGALVLILMILIFSIAARSATRNKFMEEK